jgi:hypothetical protein
MQGVAAGNHTWKDEAGDAGVAHQPAHADLRHSRPHSHCARGQPPNLLNPTGPLPALVNTLLPKNQTHRE